METTCSQLGITLPGPWLLVHTIVAVVAPIMEFPHIRPTGIIFLIVFYSKVTVHKCASIIRGRALYEEMWYFRKILFI